MRLWFLFMIAASISPCSTFLWTLLGNTGCNCCKCQLPSSPALQMFNTQYNSFNNLLFFTPLPYARNHVHSNTHSEVYTSPLFTSSPSYRGSPKVSPTRQEQLQLDESTYSTNQVTYHSEWTPISVTQNGDNALSQLESELAVEKYKYSQNKANEKKEKNRKNRIKVFKIKPHNPNNHTNVVKWTPSQVAKYTNEKAVDNFNKAPANDIRGDLEEFIPIEVGNEPDLADEQPAGPPPNVRNRISHDPILVLRRRRVIV